MKKLITIIPLVFLLCFASGCQTTTEGEPVDLTAAKNAVNTVLDNHYEAMEAKDINTLANLLTDDGLYCGTDPEEFWNKEECLELLEGMFSNESFVFKVSIDKREIRMDADGNSATCVDQFTYEPISQKIPIRTIFHFVKIGDDWKNDFISWSLVPKNADLPKLDKALE